jgi:hypothetical protein
MGFLDLILGGGATKKAGKQNAAALQGLNTRGQGYINEGASASRGFLSQIPELYEPYAASGAAARTTLDDALGIGEPGGADRARAAFRTGPGYDFRVDESLRAAERAAAAGGMLASGNTMIELQNRGAALADQEFDSWLDRLERTVGGGMQAVGGQASGKTNQAQLEQEILAQKLGLDASVVSGLNANRNNVAAAKEQGVANMLNLGTKFLSFLNPAG